MTTALAMTSVGIPPKSTPTGPDDDRLDESLEETFPASDPIAPGTPHTPKPADAPKAE